MTRSLHTARQHLLDIFLSGIRAVEGRSCVARYLAQHPADQPVCLVAIGKAATAMASGAVQQLGDRLLHALVVTKAGHLGPELTQDERFRCIEAGHPIPDARSLEAGAALIEFIETTPSGAGLLFLISGGTSSLVEVLPAGIGLPELQRVNAWLLASGLPIEAMNHIRQSLSRIKGGRLADRLDGRDTTVLMISDVAGDNPAVIGSGLLCAAAGGNLHPVTVPDWLECLLAGCPPAPPEGDRVFGSVRHAILARLEDALRASCRCAAELGYAVTCVDERLTGDAVEAGEDLIGFLLRMSPGVYVQGGETTVRLPPDPGQGGRNQSLALAAARRLSGHENILLLAAGTDGSDGPTDAAGAVVDVYSVARGEAQGLDAADCLQRADAGRFLHASQDLICTGPTGTNVTDMVIGMKLAQAPVSGGATI